MANRWTRTKSREKLLCGHPNTEENTMKLGDLTKCMTCKQEEIYIPAHVMKRKKMPKKVRLESSTETTKSDSSPTETTEKVTVVG